MTSWRDEYTQALHDRDVREQASYQRVDTTLLEAFTHLLDLTAALKAEKAAREEQAPVEEKGKRDTAVSNNEGGASAQVRSDLAEALRANGQLQSRLRNAEAELGRLRVKSRAEGKVIEELTKERVVLVRKVGDRDEEVRGKGKLLADVHDEVMSLTLQLNMAEQKVERLRGENKELIDRWMASKRREAEEMNETLDEKSKSRERE